MAKSKKPASQEPTFKIKYVVYRRSGGTREWVEAARYDSYEEAEVEIARMFPGDVMGTLEYKIDKVFTNKDD